MQQRSHQWKQRSDEKGKNKESLYAFTLISASTMRFRFHSIVLRPKYLLQFWLYAIAFGGSRRKEREFLSAYRWESTRNGRRKKRNGNQDLRKWENNDENELTNENKRCKTIRKERTRIEHESKEMSSINAFGRMEILYNHLLNRSRQ